MKFQAQKSCLYLQNILAMHTKCCNQPKYTQLRARDALSLSLSFSNVEMQVIRRHRFFGSRSSTSTLEAFYIFSAKNAYLPKWFLAHLTLYSSIWINAMHSMQFQQSRKKQRPKYKEWKKKKETHIWTRETTLEYGPRKMVSKIIRIRKNMWKCELVFLDDGLART